jgi:hypothetical protein
LVAVAPEEGPIVTKMGEPVGCLGVEVKSLNSSAEGGDAAVAACTGHPRVAAGGFLGEEVEPFPVHQRWGRRWAGGGGTVCWSRRWRGWESRAVEVVVG